MIIAFILLYSLSTCTLSLKFSSISSPADNSKRGLKLYSTKSSATVQDLEKILYKEYGSFFSPMFTQYYSNNVEFVDPLTSLVGVDKYQNNVDMLAGRTFLGKLLFKDASIVLHNVESIGKNQLQTRWTLQVTAKSFPWQPRARFTGISLYTLNDERIIVKQEDFWDSINLIDGKYKQVSLPEALGDFIGQLQKESGAEMSAPELPVLLKFMESIIRTRLFL